MAGARDPMRGELPKWLNTALIFGTFAAVAVLELRRPLRREREDKMSHKARNAAFAGLAAVTVALAEKPVVGPLAQKVQTKRLGLVKWLGLPPAAEVLLSVLLLDYTLFIWHVLTHKIPLLWRFHKPHHADLDLDASTALRFHFGELILSVPWRAAQVRLIGTSPFALALWQTLTLMAILFHHSNLRLPRRIERRLCRIIVTPRMHGIHHSVVREETDSNWSTIMAWPDYLHRTIRLNVLQDSITIGVPGFQEPQQVTLGKALVMPFEPQVEVEGPKREPLPVPRTVLAV